MLKVIAEQEWQQPADSCGSPTDPIYHQDNLQT